MSVANVKPSAFAIEGEGTIETIPYVKDFVYDEDESILFGATAWINCDSLVVDAHGFSVRFSLADVLNQGIAQIDEEPFSEDKEALIDYLLPVLKNAVAELEMRQETLKK